LPENGPYVSWPRQTEILHEMKKILFTLLLPAIGIILYSQKVSGPLMPVTTVSVKALEYYNEALKCFDDVNLKKGHDLLVKALKEDSDFFMANYQMAMYCIWTEDLQGFEEYSEAALSSKPGLSQAEEILKGAVSRLKDYPGADVTDAGKKLVEMYPNDINAYNNLIYFQSIINDQKGQLETVEKALKIAKNPAPLYNTMGYIYLALKQYDKAESAFDKYIEADPRNPNVYDSKGDFYMVKKEFKKAYEFYIKACSMDPGWDNDKALRAKALYEQTEGKRIDIITM
jgi:tetratricopeptide (TPR) repeat protein